MNRVITETPSLDTSAAGGAGAADVTTASARVAGNNVTP